MQNLFIYDTTLRDGTQGEKVVFTAPEKMEIAKRLDEFGIAYIEGGWPGSNPRDIEFFEMAKTVTFKNARLVAFGSTRKANTDVANDVNIQLLLRAETSVVAVFGKSWDLHVKEVLKTSLKENVAMIHDTVRYLKEQGKEVVYDAEHFFDGYKNNPEYALLTIATAYSAGADHIVLCDTNGGTLPHEINSVFDAVRRVVKDESVATLGIHTHNDSGMAEANSVMAVVAGARMVQGTCNGYGERCGNADLITLIPVLQEKMCYGCVPSDNMSELKSLSRFVSEMANERPWANRPFVGNSAFAHKGGVHVSAMERDPRSYEHMDPCVVGNKRRYIVSDMSGKSNVEIKARQLGVELTNGDLEKVIEALKAREAHGYQFEIADASLRMFMLETLGRSDPFFELESFRVTVEKKKDSPCNSEATVKVSVGDSTEIAAAEGAGPVGALDSALRKALHAALRGNDKKRCALEHTELTDYKVRIANGSHGTQALVRVLIESRDPNRICRTIGASTDIIEASFQALQDSINYLLGPEQV